MSREKIYLTDVGKKIKTIRELRGLSQKDFAKSLGYSQGYIADIETGRTKPSRRLLEAILMEYSESIAWLLLPENHSDLVQNRIKYAQLAGILFLYAFTQKGLNRAEQLIRNAFKDEKNIFIDASRLKNINELLRKVVKKAGNNETLLEEIAQVIYSEKISMIVIKNVSRSKIPNLARWIVDIFLVIFESCVTIREDIRDAPRTNLLLLDFPDYLQKKIRYFRRHMNVIPIYMGDAIRLGDK